MPQHVAVDVHQRTLFVVAQDAATGEERFHRRFEANEGGEAALVARLGPGDVVVMEATRGTQLLANRLEASGATVRIIDPREAPSLRTGCSRGKKSDYRDCVALLKDLRAAALVDVWRPDAATRELRQLTRERQAYNQGVTQLKNRIRSLLREEGLSFPGKQLWGSDGRAWLQAQALTEGARQILLREWGALQAWLNTKESQEAALLQRAVLRPEVVRLLQLLGFGPQTALIFLGEVGDVGRFPTAKHLVSYAGLNPRVYDSGDRCVRGGISKAGRTQLRWVLVEAAWAHVLANGPEAAHYHRLVKRGKPKQVAIVALARRLLVLAYLLLQRETTYRGVDPTRYYRKLTDLASWRSPSAPRAAGELRHTDWAAARLREMLGEVESVETTAPETQQHPAEEREVDGRPFQAEGSEGEGTTNRAARRQVPKPPLGRLARRSEKTQTRDRCPPLVGSE
jgi:transposase